MTKPSTIAQLYSEIPGMMCLPGCTACCSHVPWSKDEWEALPDDIKAGHTLHSIKCPFVGKDGCTCYEYRPFTCRIFGVADGMECPRGAIPQKKISFETASRLSRQYAKHFEVIK